MALMPGLEINVGQAQQLKLTPQLQQSIKVLQYSALDVQQLVERSLEENCFLELEEEEELASEIGTETDALHDNNADEDAFPDPDPLSSTEDTPPSTDVPEELDTDAEWQDVFADADPLPSSAPSSRNGEEEYTAPENYTSEEKTLHDHLYWQLDIHTWPDERQRLIAEFIVDAIDEDGYLHTSVEELAQSISQETGESVTVLEVEQALAQVQQFEPTGVGARDLRECLLLQLHADARTDDPLARYHEKALDLIENHFELLATHQFKRIQRRYKLNDEELEELIRYIQSYDPRPGRCFAPTQQTYIVPDLILTRRQGQLQLELNPEAYPRLRLNPEYISLVDQIPDRKQVSKLKEQLADAKNLIKSLQHRGQTLLRVGRYIVEKQKRFFEEGERGMQTLVLREVAEALDLHESTISRATSQKYIQTPRGTFELKYFFSAGVSQGNDAAQSAVAIKSYIREFIEQEDPARPLSDSKIMKMLEEKGIQVARRTIAKYREAMGIPSSSERKRLNYFKKHRGKRA